MPLFILNYNNCQAPFSPKLRKPRRKQERQAGLIASALLFLSLTFHKIQTLTNPLRNHPKHQNTFNNIFIFFPPKNWKGDQRLNIGAINYYYYGVYCICICIWIDSSWKYSRKAVVIARWRLPTAPGQHLTGMDHCPFHSNSFPLKAFPTARSPISP